MGKENVQAKEVHCQFVSFRSNGLKLIARIVCRVESDLRTYHAQIVLAGLFGVYVVSSLFRGAWEC